MDPNKRDEIQKNVTKAVAKAKRHGVIIIYNRWGWERAMCPLRAAVAYAPLTRRLFLPEDNLARAEQVLGGTEDYIVGWMKGFDAFNDKPSQKLYKAPTISPRWGDKAQGFYDGWKFGEGLNDAQLH